MTRFKTLMLREWMQHRTGWLLLAGVPLGLLLMATLFGSVQLDVDDSPGIRMAPALPVTLITLCGTGVLLLALAWASTLLQSPGLARRDVQDRSIEFWLSLPVSHSQSLAATLFTHLLVVPWAALAVGLAGGWLLSLIVVAKLAGIGAWLALPWGQIVTLAALVALRLGVGLALATLWLSPLLLGTMAASAWLKRWGVPAVALAVGAGGALLERVYDFPWVLNAVRGMGRHASQAIIAADRGSQVVFSTKDPAAVTDLLGHLPGLLLGDLGDALAQAASPAFLLALAGGAAAFGLLWLRRERGA